MHTCNCTYSKVIRPLREREREEGHRVAWGRAGWGEVGWVWGGRDDRLGSEY